MNVEIHLQVWHELKEYILGADISTAADDFITILVEHGADPVDIQKFALDDELKSALTEYLDVEEEDDDYEYGDDEEYDGDYA